MPSNRAPLRRRALRPRRTPRTSWRAHASGCSRAPGSRRARARCPRRLHPRSRRLSLPWKTQNQLPSRRTLPRLRRYPCRRCPPLRPRRSWKSQRRRPKPSRNRRHNPHRRHSSYNPRPPGNQKCLHRLRKPHRRSGPRRRQLRRQFLVPLLDLLLLLGRRQTGRRPLPGRRDPPPIEPCSRRPRRWRHRQSRRGASAARRQRRPSLGAGRRRHAGRWESAPPTLVGQGGWGLS